METKPKRVPFNWLFRWKLWRVVVLLAAGLATAYALFCAEENFRGKRAWESYKAEVEAKGEVLDFTKFVPPPVPDNQNFAMTPFLAPLFDFIPGTQKTRDTNAWLRPYKVAQLLPDNWRESLDSKWRTAKSLDLVESANELLATNRHTHEPPRFSPEQTQAAAQTIISKLEPVAGIIEELRNASRRPYSRFNIAYDWEPKFSILLPNLAPVKTTCSILELRSCAELQLGNTNAAFEDVSFMFRLVQSIRTEPFLISQLVRAACLVETLQPVWEGLEQRRWSDKQLEEFIKDLRELDFMGDGIRCLQAEQCFCDTLFAQLRRSRNPVQDLDNLVGLGGLSSSDDFSAAPLGFVIPSGWYYFEQLNYHRLYDLETAGVMTTRGIDPDVANQRTEEAVGNLTHGNAILRHQILAKLLLPSLSSFEFKMTRAQTWVNLAVIACALERYRLAHGDYPETLAALAPEYLAVIPSDLIMDQPLKYHRADGGTFILYSVGWNKKDDSGVAGKESRDTYEKGNRLTSDGDWVWKYPAASVSQ